jgi:co-chaperonin GroES (HSP10)
VSKGYTIGGKPFVPVAGMIHYLKVKDPSSKDGPNGITLAALPIEGNFIGRVIAVDETILDKDGNPAKHVCKPGDIVYFRAHHVEGSFRVDGGEHIRAVRECLVHTVIPGGMGVAFTDEENAALRSQIRQNMQEQAIKEQLQQNASDASSLPPMPSAQQLVEQ